MTAGQRHAVGCGLADLIDRERGVELLDAVLLWLERADLPEPVVDELVTLLRKPPLQVVTRLGPLPARWLPPPPRGRRRHGLPGGAAREGLDAAPTRPPKKEMP